MKAMAKGLPVAHTLLLTLVTGPLGLFSHWATQVVMGGGGGGGDGGACGARWGYTSC
jgi:hypothetical protein